MRVNAGLRRRWSALLLGPLALAIVGCSSGITPIDPREPGLPVQTRKWLAAAQDGVMAARARRDAAAADLETITAWADRTMDEVGLDDRTDDSLGDLTDARVALAELDLELAERQVTYVEAKLDLTYAERSVHHDLGNYDLQPLQEVVDAARTAVADLVREREEVRQESLRSVGAWWQAYAAYAGGGGDTRSYWIGDREPITDVVESEESPPASDGDSEGADEDGDTADDASGDS